MLKRNATPMPDPRRQQLFLQSRMNSLDGNEMQVHVVSKAAKLLRSSWNPRLSCELEKGTRGIVVSPVGCHFGVSSPSQKLLQSAEKKRDKAVFRGGRGASKALGDETNHSDSRTILSERLLPMATVQSWR